MRTAALAVVAVLLIGCGTFSPLGDGATIYRNPDTARTILTALETLRYQSARDVSKAYNEGRISQERAVQYSRIDDRFRVMWSRASQLVIEWQASRGAPPPDLQTVLDEVTALVGNLEQEARRVNDGTSERVP